MCDSMPPWEPPRENRAEYFSHFEQYGEHPENPIAKLFRAEWEEERRKLRVIDGLLGSLTPDDGQLSLFTFAEVQQWDLKHTKKRAKDDA